MAPSRYTLFSIQAGRRLRDVQGLLNEQGKVELATRLVHSGLLRIERL